MKRSLLLVLFILFISSLLYAPNNKIKTAAPMTHTHGWVYQVWSLPAVTSMSVVFVVVVVVFVSLFPVFSFVFSCAQTMTEKLRQQRKKSDRNECNLICFIVIYLMKINRICNTAFNNCAT